MSGAQQSGFANQLFDPMMAIHQQEGQNQLLLQQQDIGSHEMEMASRLAGTLMDKSLYPTPEARAAAYPTLLANARAAAPGYFKNAPATYPGDDQTQALAGMSLSLKDRYTLGLTTPPGTQEAINAALRPGSQPATTSTGSGAAGGGAAAPNAGGATIGQRQNNPGNLTFAGQPYASPGQGNRFASFPDMATGVAANADQLSLYQTQHGINTVRGAVTRWVGDPKADLTTYVGDIAKSLGVGPDDKIDLTDPAVQAKFIQAQFPHESAGGGYVLNPADVAKGVQMAAARRGQQVQPAPPGGGVVARNPGAVQVAGPGAGPPTATSTAPSGLAGPRPLPPTGPGASVVTPQQLANTPTNQVMPGVPNGPPAAAPPSAAPAAPGGATTAQQQQPPATRASLPRAADVPTGVNSPQYQQAADLQRRALTLEAQVDPTGRLKQLAAGLRQQAQLLLQTDSVTNTQEGQLHTLTGKIDDPAKPLADYHETTPGSGIWVGGPGTEPRFQPPGRLVVGPDGTVWQTSTSGAHVLQPSDPAAIAARKAAEAQGTGTGTAVAAQLPAMIAQARNAAQQEGQIDYATNQLREATKGGVPTGYFSQGLATAAAAAKSLGIDTSMLGINPEAVGNIQTAQKTLAVIGGAILQQAIGKDSSITDAKIEHFIHTQPGIETDPQALQRIMAWARSQYTYEREMGTAAVNEAAKSPTGTLPLNWQAAYFRDHGFAPIYDPGTREMQQPDGRQPTRETPPAAPTAPVNPSARTAGTTYQTPKGPMKWTGTGWAVVQ